MPGQAGAKSHAALELLRRAAASGLLAVDDRDRTPATRGARPRARIRAPARAGLGRGFPVHVPRAVIAGSRGSRRGRGRARAGSFPVRRSPAEEFRRIPRSAATGGIDHGFDSESTRRVFSRNPKGNWCAVRKRPAGRCRGAGNVSSTFCARFAGAERAENRSAGQDASARLSRRALFLISAFPRSPATPKTTAAICFVLCNSAKATPAARRRCARAAPAAPRCRSAPIARQPRNQDAREQAGQHHEQQIIAGIERGQRHDENPPGKRCLRASAVVDV